MLTAYCCLCEPQKRYPLSTAEIQSHLSIQRRTPSPCGWGSVMWCASHVKLPPKNSARIGAPLALACSSSSRTSTPAKTNSHTLTPEEPPHLLGSIMPPSVLHERLSTLQAMTLPHRWQRAAEIDNAQVLMIKLALYNALLAALMSLQAMCRWACDFGGVFTCALSHDEAIPVAVPRPRCLFRLLIALGQRLARDEAADARRNDRRIGTPGQHQICFPPLYVFCRTATAKTQPHFISIAGASLPGGQLGHH